MNGKSLNCLHLEEIIKILLKSCLQKPRKTVLAFLENNRLEDEVKNVGGAKIVSGAKNVGGALKIPIKT